MWGLGSGELLGAPARGPDTHVPVCQGCLVPTQSHVTSAEPSDPDTHGQPPGLPHPGPGLAAGPARASGESGRESGPAPRGWVVGGGKLRWVRPRPAPPRAREHWGQAETSAGPGVSGSQWGLLGQEGQWASSAL